MGANFVMREHTKRLWITSVVDAILSARTSMEVSQAVALWNVLLHSIHVAEPLRKGNQMQFLFLVESQRAGVLASALINLVLFGIRNDM